MPRLAAVVIMLALFSSICPASDIYAPTMSTPSGNRYVPGTGDISEAPETASIPNSARWIAGMADNGGVTIVAAVKDGTLYWVHFPENGSPMVNRAGAIPPGMPPVALKRTGRVIPGPVPAVTAPATHPVFPGKDTVVVVDASGNIAVTSSERTTTHAVDALPDARLLVDDRGRVLVLTGPTRRYGHGVLGDAVEATGYTIIHPEQDTTFGPFMVGTSLVIEQIAPIWADITGNGSMDVILTTSDADDGARISVMTDTGAFVAESTPIGSGNRWRHVIAAAPFAVDGTMEIVDVRTPHIGGLVEFFAVSETQLIRTATYSGAASHRIGSRNIDMAVAADMDGDERPEVIVPGRNGRVIVGVKRTAKGAARAWQRSLTAPLSSNMIVVPLPGDRVAFALATTDRTISVWMPEKR